MFQPSLNLPILAGMRQAWAQAFHPYDLTGEKRSQGAGRQAIGNGKVGIAAAASRSDYNLTRKPL